MKTKAEKIVNYLVDKSPTIMTGIAVGTAIGSVVLAINATPKAMELLKKKELESEKKELTKKEIVETTWKCYIPTAISLSLSITSMILAHRTNMRKNAALAAALSLSEQTLSTFTQKTIEKIGEKKTSDIQDEVLKEKIDKHPVTVNGIFDTGKGDVLFYDVTCDRYFYHDVQLLRKAINDLNMDLRSDMYLSLNDVYYELKLKPCGLGSEIGWNVNYEGQIDYELRAIMAENETPCLALTFHNYSPNYKNGYVR